MEVGFASLAVVPIRYEGEVLGAVQMADERKGLASPDIVAFVEESLAPLIGEAINRFRMEESLRKGRQQVFSVLNLLPGFVALKDARRRIRFANHKFLELFSVPGERACHLVQHGRTAPCDDCHLERVLRTRQLQESDRVYPNQRVYHVWSYPFTDGDGAELVLELGLDVTEQKQLENQVLEVSELERRRVGRDLHESLGQKLAGASFLLEGLVRDRGPDGPQDDSVAAQVIGVLKDSVAHVRAITKGLDPVDLGGGGFLAGLEHLAAGAEKTYGVQCRFRCDEEPPLRDKVTATHLYHIAREAVANAARHGQAKRIEIVLTKDDRGVILWVKDDGTGIAQAGPERSGGMGLRIMRYRAGAAGGTLTVLPGPEGGTVVRCHIPGPQARKEEES
jgi:signal transduction histidine kinase